MFLSTLSPGSKKQWVNSTIQLNPDGDVPNPFCDKSGIQNHKMKLEKINQRKEMIQSMYKNHQTWAQFEEEKWNNRDKYYQTKMDE